MKPAPQKKPRRIRAIIVYTVPADEFLGLKHEERGFDFQISKLNGRRVKSSHFELAEWGSGKRGSLLKGNRSNYPSNNPIGLADKNADNKLMRYINLGSKDRKNAR